MKNNNNKKRDTKCVPVYIIPKYNTHRFLIGSNQTCRQIYIACTEK